jgi:two-component system NtrC family sensor kinase
MRSIARSLRGLECEACVPLARKEELIGVVTLGKKIDGGIYNTEEIRLLATLGNQAAIAIENARLYEDLRQQTTRAQRAERLAMLGTLTAGLAHEIRNPLVSVKTFLQLLPERVNDEEFRTTFLDITMGEVERISNILAQFLDFARPSEPNLRPENLAEVTEVMALLADAEAAKQGITIVRHYAPDVPKAMIDLEQIKQVLQNILNNAVQATPRGGRVEVTVRAAHGPGGGRQVQIEISDSGKGIPEEDLEKIFTPFFTTKEAGTGLGLPVAHRIIEEHGGTIEVTSQLDQGTSFVITLPLNPLTRSVTA